MDRYKKRALNFSTTQDQRFLRAQRRSVDRRSIRDNDLFLRRNLEPLEENIENNKPSSIPTASTAVNAPNPSRYQLLQKWKSEKEMRKRMEDAKKKPVFKVMHVQHPPPISGSSGDFQALNLRLNMSRPTSRLNTLPPPSTRVTRSVAVKSKVTVPSTASYTSATKHSQVSTFGFSLKPAAPSMTKTIPAPSNRIQPKMEKGAKVQLQKSSERVQKFGQLHSSNLKPKTTSLTKLSDYSNVKKERSFAPPNFKFTAPPQVKGFTLEKVAPSKYSSVQQAKSIPVRRCIEGTKNSTSAKIATGFIAAKGTTVLKNTQLHQSAVLKNEKKPLDSPHADGTHEKNSFEVKNESFRRSARLSAMQKIAEKEDIFVNNTQIDQRETSPSDEESKISQHNESALEEKNLEIKQPSHRRSTRLSSMQRAIEIMQSEVEGNNAQSTHLLSSENNAKELAEEEKENISQSTGLSSVPNLKSNLLTSFEKCSLSADTDCEIESKTTQFNNSGNGLPSSNTSGARSVEVENKEAAKNFRMTRRSSQNIYKLPILPSIDEPEEYCNQNISPEQEISHGDSIMETKVENDICGESKDPEKNVMQPRLRSARFSALQNINWPNSDYVNKGGKGICQLESLPENITEIDRQSCNIPKQNRVSLLGTPVIVKHRRGRVSAIKEDLMSFSPSS